MRIAINTRVLIKDKLEGVGWYIYEVVKRLVHSHPEHTFILIFDRPFHNDFNFGPNVLPVVANPQARHPVLFALWFELVIPRILKKYKADLFFSPDGFLSLRASIPQLLTVHDLAYKHFPLYNSYLQRSYYQYFMPKFLARADQIIAVSEATRQDIIDSGISPTNVIVAYNAANDRFKPADEETCQQLRVCYTDNQPFFLYVGAIHPRKNIRRLITSFSRFKAESALPHKLVLLGRMAWMSADVQQAIIDSRYAADIIQVGYKAESLPAFYSASTALVYVSLFEGFGLPILEAMCCDTAVISSATSSMPEVAGKAALLIDPYSETHICDAMIRIIKEPGLRDSLIQEGRLQRQLFSWEKSADAVWSCLESLLPVRA